MMEKPKQRWTIGSILQWTQRYFKGKGVDSPRLDAEVLLAAVLRQERIALYVHFDEPLQTDELAVFHEMVKQRALRVPVAYILGRREFMGDIFKVTPEVLVPRPDTEILVETALERLSKNEPLSLLDVGTGSGAIVLSLLKRLPQARGVAVDISSAALAVAKENAASLAVDSRVEFLRGDVFSPVRGRIFDAIVSNPPYIPDGDIAHLEPEVRQEPRIALAGGSDGLSFYRRLVKDSGSFLRSGAFMALEVGIHQAQAVKQLAEKAGCFEKPEIRKDFGGIERVVVMRKRVE